MSSIKLLGVSLLLVGFSLSVNAQGIDQYFEKYQDDDRFSRVKVSSRMFDLFVDLEMDDPDQQAFVETISKLDGLKVLIGDMVDEAPSLYKQMLKGPESNMDELLTVSETGNEFRFFVRESNGMISELVMVGYDQQQVMMMSLTGDIDLKEIATLSQKMNIEGFDNFRKVHEE